MATPKRNSGPKETTWDPGEANPKQLLFYQAKTMFVGYGGAKGGGKALKNGTPVCAPNGWVPIEELKPGDKVTGSDGKPATVLGVYPQGEKKLYSVRFRDGFEIVTSGDHLWKCRITGKPHKIKGRRYTRDNWEILTTEQMREKFPRLRSNQSIVIPLCRPIEWPKRELPVAPYIIGALIGDGAMSGKNVSFTSADEEVLDRFRAEGYELHKRKQGYDYGVIGIRGEIVKLGLNGTCYEKRIPELYLNGCVEDRLELLRGLMDTDGFCDKRGHCSYCSVNEDLAKDVQYLVRSLGGMATVSRKDRKSGLSYEVTIRMPNELNDIFYLTRKRERLKLYNAGVSDVARRIVEITEAGSGECTCIRVDSEDSLFVADGFVVTHNTHAVRVKAFGGALFNPGIRILVMRLTYPALEENHIIPMRRMATQTGAATYNGTTHMLLFTNGSTIRFGHWSGEESEDEYNGQEYDWVFIDEATQFSERAFNFLGGLLRGASPIPKRMYLTANPGGVGHRWVKRLFIDRQYKTNCENPEENENPEDYTFIFATVDDNTHMLEHSPNYLKNLAQMPEDLRRAYRYGDWDALGGGYFKEFQFATHMQKPFRIPEHWPRYRSFDYGLDCFACIWWAVDTDGRAWAYREVEEKGLIVQKAAICCLENSPVHERIMTTYAPWDLWSRSKETGKSMAETFLTNGVSVVSAPRDRVQGHMAVKTMMANMPLTDPYVISLYPEGKAPATLPGLMFFNDLTRVAEDLRDIQTDEDNPNDCAKIPHEVTHTVDACRYFCISRSLKAEEPKVNRRQAFEDSLEKEENYETFMCGGEPSEDYLAS